MKTCDLESLLFMSSFMFFQGVDIFHAFLGVNLVTERNDLACFNREKLYCIHIENVHVNFQIPVSIRNMQGQRYPNDIVIFVWFYRFVFPFNKGKGIPYICSDHFMYYTVISKFFVKCFVTYVTKVDIDCHPRSA